MKVFANPRVCMWICRLVPAALWIVWLVVIFSSRLDNPQAQVGLWEALLFILIVPYLLLIYFLLPELLFFGAYRGFSLGYFLFAGLTAGLGPLIWYFWTVDPLLRRMAAAPKQTGQQTPQRSER